MQIVWLLGLGCTATTNPPEDNRQLETDADADADADSDADVDADTDADATGHTADTSDPCADPPQPEILSAEATCMDANTVQFTLTTNLVVDTARVFTQETGNPTPQYADEHTIDLVVVQKDECGELRSGTRTLQAGVQAPGQPDVSTLFPCTGGQGFDGNALTQVFAVLNSGGIVEDCDAIGDGRDDLVNGTSDRAIDPSFPVGSCL
ncbi:MAG: hypothetical protein AAGA48_00360 [Myxococcota bacterium]